MVTKAFFDQWPYLMKQQNHGLAGMSGEKPGHEVGSSHYCCVTLNDLSVLYDFSEPN